MAEPAVTELGKNLRDNLAPLAGPDASSGWPLLLYCDALMAQGQSLRDQVRGGQPYASLMNPATCPPEALPYLAQFAGVDLETLRKAIVIRQQNLIYNPNFDHDAVNAVPASWFNGGKAATAFRVTEAWEAGRKALEIITAVMAKGEINDGRVQGALKLGSTEHLLLAKEEEHYTFRMLLNVKKIVGSMKFKMLARWYNINGEEFSSTELHTTGSEGILAINGTVQAPPGTVACVLSLVSEATAAASKAELFIDEVMLAPSPKGEEKPYGDGDTSGWAWLGTVGNSQQSKQEVQNEEEFTEAQRELIASIPASKRGTLGAQIAAAQQYLTGNKTVFVVLRPTGTFWRITFVTYESETPNAAQVKQAIEGQLYAGVILEYDVVPGATYVIVVATYKTYKELWESAFLTYNGLRSNVLGT